MTKTHRAAKNRERREYTTQDVENYIGQYFAMAREDFSMFRRLMRPNMLRGWWTDEIERELMQFYRDLIAGRRPKLALQAPPQHGKTWLVLDFVAWLAGKHPELRIIFASYSDELGLSANNSLQRMIKSPLYAAIFRTRIDEPGWQCNNDLIEFVGDKGSFRNTTVNGQITGLTLNLGIIDDPVKGRAEASSKLTRDKAWNWFTDDFFTRPAADAGLLMIMTRWHVDDLLGRALDKFHDFKVLKYPAIAGMSRDGRTRNWTDCRKEGEALFPELKPLEFLLERKSAQSDASWEALYQQDPYIAGGGQLPIEKLRVVPSLDRSKVITSVRYIDKAGTEGGGAHTACCLMHKLSDKTYVIENITRGQWSALEREDKIKALAQADHKIYKSYSVYVEQEPGSGGKESAESTIRNLSGIRVYADKVTGAKEIRAEPFAAQVQGGNISLVAGEWVMSFLEECEAWPMSRYKDQVDAAAGAFNKLVGTSSYNQDYKAWAY